MDVGSTRLKLDLNKKNSEANPFNDYCPNSPLSRDHQAPHPMINLMQATRKIEEGDPKSNTEWHENAAMQTENGTKQKKSRRNWTKLLHLRFLQAVEFLGGAQAASPKRIKQAMKVEGLTDNEIKSHLQAYRKKVAKYRKIEKEEEESIWENGLRFSIDQDIEDCCSTNGK